MSSENNDDESEHDLGTPHSDRGQAKQHGRSSETNRRQDQLFHHDRRPYRSENRNGKEGLAKGVRSSKECSIWSDRLDRHFRSHRMADRHNKDLDDSQNTITLLNLIFDFLIV